MAADRFAPHPRILQTLIGSNLYPDRTVPLRELIQNARDAVAWRQALDETYLEPTITVGYSGEAGWFEVADNGIGMDSDDVRASLLSVGSDKYEALGTHPEAEQIALFGIGFLSVFLVADHVTVWTKKRDRAGSRVEITSVDEPVRIVSDDSLTSIGTRVRVQVRADAGFDVSTTPEVLRKFARHVENISLIHSDSGLTEPVEESWETAGLWAVTETPPRNAVRVGRSGFSDGLRSGGVISNRFLLCNAGFLVENRALDLVQLPPAAGYSGELDLHPGSLNIVMARERFQRDGAWAALGGELRQLFLNQAANELQEGALRPTGRTDEAEVRRTILVWEALLPDEPDLLDFKHQLRGRVWQTVPFPVSELGPRTLESVTNKVPGRRIYVRRLAAPTRATRSVDDEGSPVQFMEEIRYSVRVGALRARGFEVVEVGQFRVTLESERTASDTLIDEEAIVRRSAEPRSIEVRDIADAPPEDMNLNAIEVLPVLHGFLELAGGLRFARIPESQRRVVADPSGIHYLNVDAPTVGRLLRSVPAAVSNPLKRRLLEAYLALEDFDLVGGRQAILELLESDELAELASANVAPLTREYIELAIEQLTAAS